MSMPSRINKQVSERYEFLKGQHDDICKAEANLVNIIAELDRAMRETVCGEIQGDPCDVLESI